jgi:hypothetical protein
MNVKSRVVNGLAIIGVLCWVVALVRVLLLSVAVGYLEYGLVLLGAILVVIAAAFWKTIKNK